MASSTNESDDNTSAAENNTSSSSLYLDKLSLVEIPLRKDTVVELYAFPEKVFQQVTSSSSQQINQDGDDDDDDVNSDNLIVFDGTGTRPYSGCLAFIQFVTSYPNVFQDDEIKSIIELGAGIGACGLLLKKYYCQNGVKIVLTDGEPLALEIAKKNKEKLEMYDNNKDGKDDNNNSIDDNVEIKKLLWSTQQETIYEQLNTSNSDNNNNNTFNKFDYVIGSDLLYYKTDADALLSTIDTLCTKAAFLPAIIRSDTLAHDIAELSKEKYGFVDLYELDVSTFINNDFLYDSIVGWYNIKFLVLTKVNYSNLPESLQCAMNKCKKRIYDPDLSSSDDDE